MATLRQQTHTGAPSLAPNTVGTTTATTAATTTTTTTAGRDADLGVPPTRGDHHFLNPNATSKSGSLNINAILSLLGKKRDAKAMKPEELVAVVEKLCAMLTYYQSKYPTISISTLGKHLINADNTTFGPNGDTDVTNALIHPLVKAYDEKLTETETALNTLKSQVNQITEKTKGLVTENDKVIQTIREEYEAKDRETRQQVTILEEKLKVLEQENALLLDEQAKNEELLTKAFQLQKTVPVLQSHITSLRNLSSTQNETISTLSTTSATLESKLDDTLHRLELTQRRNKDLLGKCIDWEKRVHDMEERMLTNERERDRAVKWRAQHYGIVEDWKNAVVELGLTELLGGETALVDSTNWSHFKGILESHVKRLKRELQQVENELSKKAQEADHFSKDNISLAQKLVCEVEKKKAELDAASNKVETLTKDMEQIKHERDSALITAQSTSRENGMLNAKVKELLMKKDSEVSEVLASTNAKLKSLRTNFEQDKNNLQYQVETLQKEKIELQCEIGHLLRSKRSTEFELENVMRLMDVGGIKGAANELKKMNIK